jgi:uncharacterized protein
MMEIKLLKKVDLEGSTFVEGFPGIGLVGPMSISYMIDKLEMECIGYIQSASFPPLISIHKGEPMYPIRLYYSKQNDIVTMFAEFAIPLDLVSEIVETVYAFVRKSKVARIYSLGGLPITPLPGQGKASVIYGVASKKALASEMQKAGLKPIVEGVSTGVSAMLLVKSKEDDLDNINMMVGVQPGIVDPRYAEAAVQCLNKLLKLNIDISELDKEAIEVEAKIREIIDKHKESHETYKNAVGDSGPSMYA